MQGQAGAVPHLSAKRHLSELEELEKRELAFATQPALAETDKPPQTAAVGAADTGTAPDKPTSNNNSGAEANTPTCTLLHQLAQWPYYLIDVAIDRDTNAHA